VRLPSAPRRPSRVAAVALLLILHLVAIDLFVHLRTTRDRTNDRLASLLLLDLPTKRAPATPAADLTPMRPPRPLLAPVPMIAIEPARLKDSATPIATPGQDTGASRSTGPGTASAAASAPLNLAIPKEFYTHPPPLTPAQEAMMDPRSNRLVLTRQEKMDVDFGVVECIAWQREPDGSIYRGPGHYRRIQGIGTNPFTAHKPGTEDRGQECVK
jgi:hypothetical protein